MLIRRFFGILSRRPSRCFAKPLQHVQRLSARFWCDALIRNRRIGRLAVKAFLSSCHFLSSQTHPGGIGQERSFHYRAQYEETAARSCQAAYRSWLAASHGARRRRACARRDGTHHLRSNARALSLAHPRRTPQGKAACGWPLQCTEVPVVGVGWRHGERGGRGRREREPVRSRRVLAGGAPRRATGATSPLAPDPTQRNLEKWQIYPVFKTACDRVPGCLDGLSSQPTLSRLENAIKGRHLNGLLNGLEQSFVDELPSDTTLVVLDIDSTTPPRRGLTIATSSSKPSTVRAAPTHASS